MIIDMPKKFVYVRPNINEKFVEESRMAKMLYPKGDPNGKTLGYDWGNKVYKTGTKKPVWTAETIEPLPFYEMEVPTRVAMYNAVLTNIDVVDDSRFRRC